MHLQKNNVACTDFCGVGDRCVNTDMRPPADFCADEDDEDEEETEEYASEEDQGEDDGEDA